MSDGYKEAEDKFECNFQGFDHWITAFGKHMYQAGMKEQREKDAVIAENDDTDCKHSDGHCGCVAGSYIADAIRNQSEV